MAGRKEYEMLFSLNAQLGGGFAGTFGKAQQQLLSLQQEIQGVNRTQSDISAYQKQQQAVEATGRKLDVLKEQYDNIQKEMQETGNDSSDLQNKLLSKQLQIDKTAASLERQKQKLDDMAASLRKAGVDTTDLENESRRLGKELEDLKKKQEDVGDGAKSFGEKASDAFSAAGAALAAAGIGVALKEIYEGYKECISIAGDFEASLSNVEALSGASSDEMAQLSALAKELGATTKFTAKESADAMGYMAMAGWDAEQMLSGMPAVMQLAAASGEDLASVSDIVTDSLTAFGLKASDTARFADVLAATAANANTSVGVMGETFKYAAPVAGALGYSIEDVSTAIGLMANAGIKGSNAGTALRNVFNGLLEGVTLTGAAFGECTVSAVQADGTMADFGTTLDELRGYFEQMTEAEQVNNAMAIAGQRGYAGLLAILNASESDYAKLTTAINNSTGAAQRMADVKMDNMVGQLTLLNSAWDAVKTTIGEQFTPILSELYGLFANVLTGINGFLQRNPALIKGLTAAVAVIGLVVGGIAAYTAAAKLAAIASAALSASIPGLNIILGVTAAIAGLVGVVVAVTSAMNEGVPSVESMTEAASGLRETMDDATSAFSETADETMAAAAVADRYISKLEEMGDYANLSAEDQKEYRNILSLLCETVPELSGLINVQTGEIEGGTAALRGNTQAWKDNAIAQAYQEELSKMYGEYADVLIEAEKNSIKLTQAQLALDDANAKQKATVARMQELWDEAAAAAEQDSKVFGYACDPINYLTQEYHDLENTLPDVNEEIYKAQKTVDNINKAIEEDAEAVAEAETEIALAEEAVKSLTAATEEEAEAQREAEEAAKAVAEQTEALNGVIGPVTEEITKLTEAYNAAYEAAYSSISGQYDLWDEAAEVVATSVESINSNLAGQATYWSDYNANLEALAGRTGDIEGLSDVIASFADGSKDSVNAIAGMATASDEDLKAMVANWQAVQEAQKATSGTIADMKTDFTNQMDELTQNMRDDIGALELGPEAAQAGRDTIQAFIDAAEGLLPDVETAYRRVAGAAARSLNPIINGVSGRAYASGTDYAEAGVALVGEEGPELVMMHGGERVLNAQETAAALFEPSAGEAGGYVISFAPVYTINGNMAPEELESVLREHDSNLREQLEELLGEMAADRARRAY